ncbi:MAG: hypothetical protein ACYDD0_09610 [Candidatus Dormibacteria bacterium]
MAELEPTWGPEPGESPGAPARQEALSDRDTLAYWQSLPAEAFRPMAPWEPIPPPNVIFHWVSDGVHYWVCAAPPPVQVMLTSASRVNFRRRYLAAGLSPARAERAAAVAWRHVERAAQATRQQAAERGQSQQEDRDRARAAQPTLAGPVRVAGHANTASTTRADRERRERERLVAEAHETKARAARRAAGRESGPTKAHKEERTREHHRQA